MVRKEYNMTTTRVSKGYIKIVAANGCVIIDIRNGKEYSEVICKANDAMFFVEKY